MTYKKFMSLFLIAGSIASTLCSCAATDSSAVVGYIDEHPITMEEFNYFLSQQKSSVCQSYSQLYGITSFDSAFWNNEYGDSTPLDSARASAKEACLEAYATQMLAEKTTSAEFLSFSQLKENAENFNTARKESTSNGGIVYGPIEYSFDSYYHRYLSQLENDIKEYWISTNAVSDADIDAFYSENQNLFSLNGDADVSAIYLSYIPSDLSADNIFLGLEEGVSLEDIQTQYPYVTDWHTYSFTNETEKSDLLSHADIVSQASSMNTGDVSEPFLDGTYPCIIKVTRKEDATVIPLAEVRNRITDYLLNSRISTETELIQNRLVFTETNDIIRYNISDDGGDFIIKYFLTANATPAYFVNNVIMYDGARTTFMHRDPFKSQTYFYNNVFYNKSTTTTTTWHDTKRYLGNLGSVTFSHNCFYEASGIHSQYEPSDDYKVTENPDMVNPGQTPQQNSDGILSGATVWDGYKLNASSPLIDAGIYVPQMGTTDFYGTQLYWGNAPDIGVHEYQQGEYNDPANFALGKTVTSNTSHESLTPDLMVDGIYSQSSRWAAANSDLPIWLDIDFGEDTTFNKVVLTENIVSGWASPRIASFNLQIPTSDGYQTIYTYDGEIGEGKDFTFDAVTASHLRMEITSLRADTSTHGRGATDPSIVEFEVYKVPVVREPQNLLLNKSVSASSSHFSCPASKVNDGDASQGSRWAAANSDLPAWLEFDLGSEQTFNSVTITENIVPNWASERITGLEFQAWNGTEYTTISTYSGTIGTSKTISLPETTSSKFKVLITGLQEDTTKNSKGQTDPSIQEIELYYR